MEKLPINQLKKIVRTLIKNNYDKVLTADELKIELDVFKSKQYTDFVNEYFNIKITKSDITQIIVNDLNNLDETDPFYNKTKQKYIDQLITISTEENNITIYEFDV